MRHWTHKRTERELLVWVVTALEVVMSEQDQLKAQLDSMGTSISGVSDRINTLLGQISAGNTQPDLQPLIDEATNEATQLQSLASGGTTAGGTTGPAPAAPAGTTPATATPAPADQLVQPGQDVTITPSTGTVVPTDQVT